MRLHCCAQPRCAARRAVNHAFLGGGGGGGGSTKEVGIDGHKAREPGTRELLCSERTEIIGTSAQPPT